MKYFVIGLVMLLSGCSRPAEKVAEKVPEKPSGYRIYVTNEISGDLSVIDSNSLEVVADGAAGKKAARHPPQSGW